MKPKKRGRGHGGNKSGKSDTEYSAGARGSIGIDRCQSYREAVSRDDTTLDSTTNSSLSKYKGSLSVPQGVLSPAAKERTGELPDGNKERGLKALYVNVPLTNATEQKMEAPVSHFNAEDCSDIYHSALTVNSEDLDSGTGKPESEPSTELRAKTEKVQAGLVISELTQKIGGLKPQASLTASGHYDDVAMEACDSDPTVNTEHSPKSARHYDDVALEPRDSTPAVDIKDSPSTNRHHDMARRAHGSIVSRNSVASNDAYEEVAIMKEVQQASNDLYHVLEPETSRPHTPPRSDTLTSQTSEGIYEPVGTVWNSDSFEEGDFDDGDWSSSEFESIETPTNSPPRTPGLLQKLSLRFGRTKSRNFKGKSFTFDFDKHPPPQLPECPRGLTEKQIKRRYVVDSIVEIENSYLNSLCILLEYYKQPLLENGILPADRVEKIFYKLDEILDCHLMFRIALYDRIRCWDEHELLGDDFLGFSKAMVLDTYSEFVNHFMTATDLLKKSMREKSALADFVNTQTKESKELVGPHGLMIKVVQRFPQYIMQIKDLLKHTPPDHEDHLKLYIALSKLQNVAYQLNEKKRTSEEKLAARVILSKIGSKNSTSILLRQDDVIEVSHGSKGEIIDQKLRRLLMFDDMLCLIKIDNSGSVEKLSHKWTCPVRDMEYQESGGAGNTSSLVRGETGAVLIQSNSTRRSGSESGAVNESTALVHKELEDLMHDQTVLAQIMTLTSSLRQDYKGLNPDLLQEQLKNVQTSIRLRDEQLQMLDNCSICLSYIRNGQRTRDVFHMASPVCKQDWVMDFRAVKLSQDSVNHVSRCWITDEPKLNYPLVVKNANVDVTSTQTQVRCAVPIFLTNTSGGIGLQYLWVCSSNSEHGQVTLLSIHSNQPHIIESFQACEGTISCCSLVPSNIHCSLDHVWMSDSTNHVYVHELRDGERQTAHRKFPVPAQVKDMCCYGNFVFLALADGSMLKCAKRKGSVLYSEPACRHLRDDNTPVNSLLPCENNKILAACGNTLFIVSAVNDLHILDKHVITDLPCCIDKMVKLGLGIWFSCTDDPSLRLIHHETYGSISEVHIGNALHKLVPHAAPDGSKVAITALSSSQGLIWVGSNTGHILTIPVPVLEGIPQQSGKVNLSSLCHTAPVRFISTINCSITFAPRALSEEDLAELNNNNSRSMQSLTSMDSVDSESSSAADRTDGGVVSHMKRGPLAKMRHKVLDRLGPAMQKQRGLATSTPNLAHGSWSTGLQRSSLGMYDSLMRLDEIDDTCSTTEILNSLVPTNQLPGERQCTKISTQRGSGTLRVTKSSSISDLAPSDLAPLRHNKRAGVQSMWALNTTSTHSVFSIAPAKDDKGKGLAMDKAYCDVNVELRDRLEHEYAQIPDLSCAKFGGRLSVRDSRPVSVNSILSRVAEDEEYIDDELSPLQESVEESSHDYMRVDDSETDETFAEEESLNGDEEDDSNVEREEALVVTNFLKASLIVSGGEGFMDLNETEKSKLEESTLILWQQNQL